MGAASEGGDERLRRRAAVEDHGLDALAPQTPGLVLAAHGAGHPPALAQKLGRQRRGAKAQAEAEQAPHGRTSASSHSRLTQASSSPSRWRALCAANSLPSARRESAHTAMARTRGERSSRRALTAASAARE